MQFLLPKFLRDLEHVRRDARRAHEPRDPLLPSIALRAPISKGPVSRLVQAKHAII